MFSERLRRNEASEANLIDATKLASEIWPSPQSKFLAQLRLPEREQPPIRTSDNGKPSEQEISTLIKQLGSDDFREREKASKSLEKIGIPAIALLKDATASENPEIRNRAIDVLKAIVLHRPEDLRWITDQVPKDRREKIEELLAKAKLDDKDKDRLLRHGKVAAAFVVMELADLIKKDGKEALSSQRGKQLVELFQSFDKEAVPACFAVLDHRRSDENLKKIAEKQLNTIAKKELADSHPSHWLYDYRDRVRRAGEKFQADYSGGRLERIKQGTTREITAASWNLLRWEGLGPFNNGFEKTTFSGALLEIKPIVTAESGELEIDFTLEGRKQTLTCYIWDQRGSP
jgi:hypothetical protein